MELEHMACNLRLIHTQTPYEVMLLPVIQETWNLYGKLPRSFTIVVPTKVGRMKDSQGCWKGTESDPLL